MSKRRFRGDSGMSRLQDWVIFMLYTLLSHHSHLRRLLTCNWTHTRRLRKNYVGLTLSLTKPLKRSFLTRRYILLTAHVRFSQPYMRLSRQSCLTLFAIFVIATKMRRYLQSDILIRIRRALFLYLMPMAR